jgi:hypothetical protein
MKDLAAHGAPLRDAIRHGGGAGRLRLWIDHSLLHLQISDQGPGFADPDVGSKPPNQAGTNGARHVDLPTTQRRPAHRLNPRGSTVTAILPLHTAPAGAGPR